jgi:hypothetical protein
MSAPTIITVPADQRWFHTGLQLAKGASYRIEVPPGQHWTDWYIDYGPEGGTSSVQRLTARWLRFRGDATGKAEYLTLIGTIGESLEHAFVIGNGPRAFTAPVSGELVCFANDLWVAYRNNSGSMTISVTSTP